MFHNMMCEERFSPVPYRRHQGRTALCWTLWHSPVQEHLCMEVDNHPSPEPCTDWTPDTPQSAPGYQDHLPTHKYYKPLFFTGTNKTLSAKKNSIN